MIDYVFVVLVYRNTADLEDFLVSTKEITGNYKVIVVNAFFDEKTKSEILLRRILQLLLEKNKIQ